VLIIAAHPDDEVIGAGALMSRIPGCVLLHVTDGAPLDARDAHAAGFGSREAYALARRAEMRMALERGGVRAGGLRELGMPDQGASLAMPVIATALEESIGQIAPCAVITHAYEGGHPDHDATAFGAAMACRALRGDAPPLLEMTGYHERDGRFGCGEFLPNGDGEEWVLSLGMPDRERKRRMLDAHATQWRTLRVFPPGDERFRRAPDYDFTQPPHEGTLHYERFDWGMTGPRWRELAAEALCGLEVAPCR
jgi:LmbE family N-acetylglucosaminyl deacetylase